MCVYRRRHQRQLHVLEVDDQIKTVHVVKEYVRAGAGHLVPDPQDLRPPDVLVHTLHYLITEYVSLSSETSLG